MVEYTHDNGNNIQVLFDTINENYDVVFSSRNKQEVNIHIPGELPITLDNGDTVLVEDGEIKKTIRNQEKKKEELLNLLIAHSLRELINEAFLNSIINEAENEISLEEFEAALDDEDIPEPDKQMLDRLKSITGRNDIVRVVITTI